LTAAGIAFEVRPAHVDEAVLAGESAETYARRVATAKAMAVSAVAPGRPVLGADTVVVVDGRILGKPADEADARRMLAMLSGRSHEVVTAVTLLVPERGAGTAPGSMETEVEVSVVHVARLNPAEIDWYVASGEPADKAGAYAIQGLASRFVTRIEGSYSNVVGLPVARVYGMCGRAGLLLS
jgi:septum formation protein